MLQVECGSIVSLSCSSDRGQHRFGMEPLCAQLLATNCHRGWGQAPQKGHAVMIGQKARSGPRNACRARHRQHAWHQLHQPCISEAFGHQGCPPAWSPWRTRRHPQSELAGETCFFSCDMHQVVAAMGSEQVIKAARYMVAGPPHGPVKGTSQPAQENGN